MELVAANRAGVEAHPRRLGWIGGAATRLAWLDQAREAALS